MYIYIYTCIYIYIYIKIYNNTRCLGRMIIVILSGLQELRASGLYHACRECYSRGCGPLVLGDRVV